MTAPMLAADFKAAMTEAYREKSGFSPEEASDLGLRMSVLAQELETLASTVRRAEKNIFPQTAEGEALDLLAEARGVSRRPGQPAGGNLEFSRTTPAAEDIQIPAGTLCADMDGQRFQTSQPAVLASGETSALVAASALLPGEAGNVPARRIKALLSGVAGISSVTNPAPFAGGTREEDDEPLRRRLLSHMADPPRAFNTAFYRQAALGYPGVASAQVLPVRRGIGTVDVFISALPGYNPAEVAQGLGAVLSQAREIGTDVQVLPAEIKECELACLLRVAQGFSAEPVLDACRGALAEQMASLEVGQGLSLARLSAVLMGVPGVENARTITPDKDLPAEAGRLLAAASIEVVEGGVGMAEVNAR